MAESPASRTAFSDVSGVSYPRPSRPRPSLQVLHSLPAGVRRQLRLADEPAPTHALSILPDAGAPTLEWGRTHEVTGWGADRFALGVLNAAHHLVSPHPPVWVGRSRDVYTLRPEALGAFIPPASLTLVDAGRRADILWAAEQVLRAPAQTVCVVQLSQGPNLAESRRLQVASEAGRSMGLILIAGRAHSSTCQTRWECDTPDVWRAVKNKTGPVGEWAVPEAVAP